MPFCSAANSARAPLALSELDGVRTSAEFPAIGAFTDVGDDDVVDEAVLEVVVAKVAGQPERLDVAPVAAAPVDAQGCGAAGAAVAFVVAGLDLAADFELAVTWSGMGSAGTMATFSYAVWMRSR